MSRARRFLALYLAVLLLVGGARLALPVALRAYVQDVLTSVEDYEVRIGDVDVVLWRGGYEVEDLVVVERERNDESPTVVAERLDLTVQWLALASGRVVGEARFVRPVVRWAEKPAQPKPDVEEEAEDWRAGLEALVPFELNRVAVIDGKVTFLDADREKPFDLVLEGLEGELLDLTNAQDADDPIPADVWINARTTGNGRLRAFYRFSPWSEQQRFDLDLLWSSVELTALNDVLESTVGMDVEDGTLTLALELAGKDGRMRGYLKPVIEDLQVVSWNDLDEPEEIFQGLVEVLASIPAEIFENQPRNRLAARITIEGPTEGATLDVLGSIPTILENAFIRALRPQVDDSISLEDVGQ